MRPSSFVWEGGPVFLRAGGGKCVRPSSISPCPSSISACARPPSALPIRPPHHPFPSPLPITPLAAAARADGGHGGERLRRQDKGALGERAGAFRNRGPFGCRCLTRRRRRCLGARGQPQQRGPAAQASLHRIHTARGLCGRAGCSKPTHPPGSWHKLFQAHTPPGLSAQTVPGPHTPRALGTNCPGPPHPRALGVAACG